MWIDLALVRNGQRTVIRVEGETPSGIAESLMPYLSEDTHVAAASTAEEVLFMASLQVKAQRARHEYELALDLIQQEENRVAPE